MTQGITNILLQMFGANTIGEVFFFLASVKLIIDFLKYCYKFIKGVWFS